MLFRTKTLASNPSHQQMGVLEHGHHHRGAHIEEDDTGNISDGSDDVFLDANDGPLGSDGHRTFDYWQDELLYAMKERKCRKDTFHYEDVGADINITVSRKENEDFGLTLICGEVFTPRWPAIIDIKPNTPASQADIKIGDQIKTLAGIDTNTLAHWQLLALFTNSTDDVTMTVRRGLDRSNTTFDWYKHPFSSVRQDFEELIISDAKSNTPIRRNTCPYCNSCNKLHRGGRVVLKSFKMEDELSGGNECHLHTMSASSVPRRLHHMAKLSAPHIFRSNGQYISTADGLTISTADEDGKSIAEEIDRMYLEKDRYENIRRRQSLGDSRNSVSSNISADSTVSTFSSSSSATYSDQANGQPGVWMEHVITPTDPCNYSDDIFERTTFDKSNESGRNISKSPGSKIRESFRRKKSKKEASISRENEDSKNTLIYKNNNDNTILLTVWVIDRKKLGLQLGGGSVSAYGDSNVKITDVKRNGTAYKVFRVGDEILEIGGVTTNGLNVYDVSRIITNLEGQYVEFKIFRPKSS